MNDNNVEKVAKNIAGEITLSDEPGKTIRKWREIFGISQHEINENLHVSSSVLSDYESGRRKSPGVASIKKIVNALIEIDIQKGSKILNNYITETIDDAIFDIKEFSYKLGSNDFLEAIEGKIISGKEFMNKGIYGYTVIDSLKAITTFKSVDYMRIYGWSTQRALVFAGVKYGRSPMVAIRAHSLKPAIVVFHRPKRIDELAIKLAKIEHIPLIITELKMKLLLSYLKNLKRCDTWSE